MKINSKDEIAGVPILSVRKLLKSTGDFFEEEFVVDRLRISLVAARKLIKELARQGYIEKAENPSKRQLWQMTMKGNALRLATAAKPITRKTAKDRLSEFLERAHEIREDDHYIYKVKRVWVFGSFLSDVKTLGDVDLAIELVAKVFPGQSFDELVQAKIKKAQRDGRNFSGFFEQAIWPQKEVWLKLKSKSRSLSLHPYLGEMEKFSTHKLIYEDKK